MMKIFGIGLSRTGTHSLHKALTEIGFHSAHFPEKILLMNNGRLAIDHSIINRYDALTDTPFAAFYQHLDKTYPDSKFILTIRNLDDWLYSCIDFFEAANNYIKHIDEVHHLHMMLYQTTRFEKDKFIAAYQNHTCDVQRYFQDKKDRLLIINICNGEGWEKLCPFLDKPVPDVPFPWTHRGTRKARFTKELQKASSFYTAGKYQEALNIFNAILSQDPANLFIQNEKACALSMLGKHREAIMLFRSILDKEESHPPSAFNLIYLSYQLGDIQSVKSYFLKYHPYFKGLDDRSIATLQKIAQTLDQKR